MIIESKLTITTLSQNISNVSLLSGWSDLDQAKENNIPLIELSIADTIENQDTINNIINTIDIQNKSLGEVVEQSSFYVFNNFKYLKGITTVETTVDEILEHKSGVCQDFAHVLLQILRTLKIPSRYVSGYICPNKNGMRGEGATHACVEVYMPNYGWLGVDPTNNFWVTNNHIVLAVGKNFDDCTPV